MTVGTILQYQKVLDKVMAIKLNGQKSYKRMKALEPVKKELKIFEELKNNFIKKNGTKEKDGMQIKQGTKAMEDYIKYMNEIAENEVEKGKPFLVLEDLDNELLTDLEMTGIVELGFIEIVGE